MKHFVLRIVLDFQIGDCLQKVSRRMSLNCLQTYKVNILHSHARCTIHVPYVA